MRIWQNCLVKFKFLIWARLKANFYSSFNLSHSQFGEDMVIRFLTNDAKKGFYVDIGAHHPVFYSNTYHFYCKGWRGINIDAAPGSMELFNVLRTRDVNLELCLSPVKGEELEFFIFEHPAYNTFDREMAEKALAKGSKVIETKILKTRTLEEVLDLYLSDGTAIDFLSIDIEGMDEAILMSTNWSRYKPKILIFEKHNVSFQNLESLPVITYLMSHGYKIVAKCGPSVILKCENNEPDQQEPSGCNLPVRQ